MQTVSIGQLINSYCIQYKRLSKMVSYSFKGSNSNEVNIFIDLHSVLKGLYRSQYAINDYSLVASSVINICGHYRKFFASYPYNVKTNFFIVYSENHPYINNQFVPHYNQKEKYLMDQQTQVKDLLLFNFNILNVLVPYLPDVYFINTTFETGVCIADIIFRDAAKRKSTIPTGRLKNIMVRTDERELSGCNIPNIILTKDLYNYQLVGTIPNTIIFRPKKKDGQDDSYIINPTNLIKMYLRDKPSTVDAYKYSDLMPGVLPLIMSIGGMAKRNIKSSMTIGSTMELVKKLVSEGKIINGYNSNPKMIWEAIPQGTKISLNSSEFENIYKAIDIRTQQLIYMYTPEATNMMFINLNDPKTLQMINNQYFTTNPLDLNSL